MTADECTPQDGENVTEEQAEELTGGVTAQAFIKPSDGTIRVDELHGGGVTVSINSHGRGLNAQLILSREEADVLVDRLIEATG